MRMRRILPWVALLAVVAGALVVGAGSGRDDPSDEARARRLAAQLRCPVCEGLSVADSPSEQARNIAADIQRRVEAGQSDEEIRQAYVESYGEWVVLAPSPSGLGALVWVLPVVALLAAAGGLAVAFRRWRRQPRAVPTEAERELVEQARAGRRGSEA